MADGENSSHVPSGTGFTGLDRIFLAVSAFIAPDNGPPDPALRFSNATPFSCHPEGASATDGIFSCHGRISTKAEGDSGHRARSATASGS